MRQTTSRLLVIYAASGTILSVVFFSTSNDTKLFPFENDGLLVVLFT